MSEQQHVERFFWFHDRIKAGTFPNSRHLVQEFEISERTPTVSSSRAIVPLLRHFLRNPRPLDQRNNFLALSLAVRLASTIPDPALKDDLSRLINRVTRITGKDEQKCLQQVDRMISVKNIEYALVDTAVFRQTVEALLKENAVRITYHSPHGKTTSTRTIQPLHLLWPGARPCANSLCEKRGTDLCSRNQNYPHGCNNPGRSRKATGDNLIKIEDQSDRMVLPEHSKIMS